MSFTVNLERLRKGWGRWIRCASRSITLMKGRAHTRIAPYPEKASASTFTGLYDSAEEHLPRTPGVTTTVHHGGLPAQRITADIEALTRKIQAASTRVSFNFAFTYAGREQAGKYADG
jgi:hypothetical protein